RVAVFKTLKKLIPLGLNSDWLYGVFGSADYRNAGPLRAIFVKVVNEDLSSVAPRITCPVTLVYGTKDTETPLEIGERLNALIKNSQMVRLQDLDHYSILMEGRHQVAPVLKRFLETTSSSS